jgi:hypothetical protein
MENGRRIISLVGTCALVVAACGDNTESGGGNVNGTSAPNAGAGNTGAGNTGGGGTAPAPTGDTIFALRHGDERQQSLGGITVDDYGNTYVVGRESNGSFVVKYSNEGRLIWHHPFPSSGDNQISLMNVAPQLTAERVVVAGRLRGNVTLDDGTTLSSATNPQFGGPEENLVLLAIDIAGNLVWSRIYGSPSFVEPERVFVTATGDVEVVGRAANDATVGGAPICCLNTLFGTNTFLARYSPTGDPIWSTGITGGQFFFVGAGADADGGMVVGGGLIGTMTFDGQTFAGGGPIPDRGLNFSAGVVVRTDPLGQLRWIRVYQAGQSSSRLDASLDAAGNVLLFGDLHGTLDLGNDVVLQYASDNLIERAGLLAKLAPDGTGRWAKLFSPNGFDTVVGRAVAADRAGNIVLTGKIAGGVSVGGPPPLPAGSSGDFVAKYEPDGGWLWSRGFAVETSNAASGRFGLGFDAAARVRVAAEFDNTVDFGTGPLTAPGEPTSGGSALPRVPDDIYLLKLAP